MKTPDQPAKVLYRSLVYRSLRNSGGESRRPFRPGLEAREFGQASPNAALAQAPDASHRCHRRRGAQLDLQPECARGLDRPV